MSKKWILIIAVIITILIILWILKKRNVFATVSMKSYLGNPDVPRGMRNNNPGNLVITDIAWQGKVPVNQNTDGTFEQFKLYSWGVRALIKEVITDINSHGYDTVEKLITDYAPKTANDTTSYIKAVSQDTGYTATQPLTDDPEVLFNLVAAIAKHENGVEAISQEDFNDAYKLI